MKKSAFMKSIYFLVLTLFFVILLFAISEVYTISHFRKQVQEVYETSVNYSFNYWANQFYMANKEIKSFLDGSSEYELLCQSDDKEEIDSSSSSIQKDLTNISVINGNQIGFFIYIPDKDIMLSSIPGSDYLQGESRKDLKRYLRETEIKNSSVWKEVQLGDTYYFLHLHQKGSGYGGCYISFDSVLRNILPETQGGRIAILNMDNSLVYELGDVSLRDSCFAYSRAVKMINKKILVELPDASFTQSGTYLFVVLLLAGAAAVLLIGIALIYQNRTVFRPVGRLKEAMLRFSKGDTDVRLEGYSENNEIRVLYGTFNYMAEQIVNLKIDVYETELERQKIYMQFLHVQIQPHFYTNILNLIYNLASIKDFDGVRQLAKCMADYFRYLLSLKDDFVILADELRCIDRYASVQKIRYQDHFQLRIDCEVEAEREKIPPLLLQTFVENSIKHNVMVARGLTILVRVFRDGKELVAEITDNGVSFPEETLKKLERDEEIEENGGHIGICNIKNRLRILYGKDAKIVIKNLEQGSCVMVRIPGRREENGI